MSLGKKSRNVGMYMNNNEGQGGKCRKEATNLFGMDIRVIENNLKYRIRQLDCSHETDHVLRR